MKTIIKTFDKLTTTELYDILRLRSEVFVVEQDCVYQDLDENDQKAIHLFLKKEHKMVAYSRLFAPGDYFELASIGRILVESNFRKNSFGHTLMKESIAAIEQLFNTSKISISAQTYLQKFYESHGFEQVGEGYLEDGIPHIRMIKQ